MSDLTTADNFFIFAGGIMTELCELTLLVFWVVLFNESILVLLTLIFVLLDTSCDWLSLVVISLNTPVKLTLYHFVALAGIARQDILEVSLFCPSFIGVYDELRVKLQDE